MNPDLCEPIKLFNNAISVMPLIINLKIDITEKYIAIKIRAHLNALSKSLLIGIKEKENTLMNIMKLTKERNSKSILMNKLVNKPIKYIKANTQIANMIQNDGFLTLR
jgi:hypothetical protein